MSKWEGDEEIEIFRQYLRIPSVQPNVNYGNFEIQIANHVRDSEIKYKKTMIFFY